MTNTVWLWAYGRALERRYPDIAVRVERLTAEQSAGTGYTGWRLDFCGDEERLIRYGLGSDFVPETALAPDYWKGRLRK